MGVNHNPARIGAGPRLELIPSMRLGMIALNRQRMRWQRRLNPKLYVGLMNEDTVEHTVEFTVAGRPLT